MKYLLDHTTFFSGFSTDYFNVKIFEVGCYAGQGFCHTNAKQHRNTGLQLLLKIWPILVFDPFPFVWIVYYYQIYLSSSCHFLKSTALLSVFLVTIVIRRAVGM